MTQMWHKTPYEAERVALALIWFTGARPSELLSLKRKNVDWGIDENGSDFFAVKLETKKLGKAQGFVVSERILKSSRPLGMAANIFIETLIRWCMKLDPEAFVLMQRSRMSLNRMMHRLSPPGHYFSVYHARHSVLSLLCRNGANATTLMFWKGSSHMGSVMRYVHAMPVYLQIENQNRSRNLSTKPRGPIKERYEAKVIERKATEKDADLPMAEKEEPAEEEKEDG